VRDDYSPGDLIHAVTIWFEESGSDLRSLKFGREEKSLDLATHNFHCLLEVIPNMLTLKLSGGIFSESRSALCFDPKKLHKLLVQIRNVGI